MNLDKVTRGKWIVDTSIGSGKSRAIIDLAQRKKFEYPHLIVVDTKNEVDRYRSELEDYDWYYETDKRQVEELTVKAIKILTELRKISNYMFLDLFIPGLMSRLEDVYMERSKYSKGFIITKAMFNKYLQYDYGTPLKRFKTITIDEITNLDIVSKFPMKEEYLPLLSSEADFKETLKRSKVKAISTPYISKPKTFLEDLLNS